MAETLLHREQHIGIAAGLDMDHAIGMEAAEMQRRREQVAPAKTPEYRTLDPGEDAGQEHGRAGVVGKVGTARDLMERPGRNATTRQMSVDGFEAEGDSGVPRANAFDPRYARTQIFDDGGLVHIDIQTRERLIRSLFVLWVPVMSQAARWRLASRSRNERESRGLCLDDIFFDRMPRKSAVRLRGHRVHADTLIFWTAYCPTRGRKLGTVMPTVASCWTG